MKLPPEYLSVNFLKTKLINTVLALPAKLNKEVFSLEKIEGLHIFVWLIKDFCWCLNFKELGILMIVPTLLISLLFIYKTKNNLSQLITNISITLWVTANSLWMLSEFFEMTQTTIFFLPIKYYFGALFVIGLLNIIVYHIYRLVNNK